MQSADLSVIFAALADPTRRAILARLARGQAPVKDLVQPLALSGPAITKHLKVLERAGLISRSRAGQQRPCRLEARALEPVADWIAQYRAMWEEQLDRLEEYLRTTAPSAREAAPASAAREAVPAPRRARSPQPRPKTTRPPTSRSAKGRLKEKP